MASSSKRDHSFIVYIDESGDEGFTFRSHLSGQGGSSRWFVVAAAVFIAETEPSDVKVVDAARIALERDPSKPLHFSDLDHASRVAYAEIISGARMCIATVLCYKQDASQALRQKSWMYHFSTRLLLERVSEICSIRFNDPSKTPIGGDGSAKVVFSHRRTMSYADFCDYLRLLKSQNVASIDWDVIDPDAIESAPHGARRGLQIADVVASAFYYSIEQNKHGHREDRYARFLKPRLYRVQGERGALNYGIKIYPSTGHEIFRRVNPDLWK